MSESTTSLWCSSNIVFSVSIIKSIHRCFCRLQRQFTFCLCRHFVVFSEHHNLKSTREHMTWTTVFVSRHIFYGRARTTAFPRNIIALPNSSHYRQCSASGASVCNPGMIDRYSFYFIHFLQSNSNKQKKDRRRSKAAIQLQKIICIWL